MSVDIFQTKVDFLPFLPSPPEVGGGVGPPPSGLLLARTGVKAENDLEDISTRKKLSFLADKTAPPFLLVKQYIY